MIKLNLGSHNKKIGEDYINIDMLKLEHVDGTCDIAQIPFEITVVKSDKFNRIDELFEEQLTGRQPFKFADNMVDKIVFEEVLEHLSFRHTVPVLKELRRILKPGGELHIQVPDCGKAMQAWVGGLVCECVPHKPDTPEGFIGRPGCPKCGGAAIMGWDRWLFSFCGAQKHFPHDIHKSIFTQEILQKKLNEAGFTNVKFSKHPVKLKVNVTK